jgi:integrase
VFDTRQARKLCAEKTEAETQRAQLPDAWALWVPRFLEQRYATSADTYLRVLNRWRNIAAFLRARAIDTPRQLTRVAVRDYVAWRATPTKETYAGNKNTALAEIGLLGMIMREAVQNGFASVNPCDRLGIHPAPCKRKPRITESEHRTILSALEKEPDWMRVSYMIAWHTGCRLTETRLHIPTQIDLNRAVIRFRTKAHKDSLAEFPLPQQLVPLFARMIAEGREWSYAMPNNPAAKWCRFFRSIKLGHLSFHCTRVTFVTRCYEAGIPRDMVKRLVGHSSDLAHDVYPRLEVTDAQLVNARALL